MYMHRWIICMCKHAYHGMHVAFKKSLYSSILYLPLCGSMELNSWSLDLSGSIFIQWGILLALLLYLTIYYKQKGPKKEMSYLIILLK